MPELLRTVVDRTLDIPQNEHMDWRKALTWIGLLQPRRPSISDVFATGGVPSVTYVKRSDLGLERHMAEALMRRNAFTIVSGPTKCGKSVLCHRIIGSQRAIIVQGGQIEGADDFWRHVAHKLGLPGTQARTLTRSSSSQKKAEATVGIPAAIQKKISMDATSGSQQSEAETYNAVLILDALAKVRQENLTLVIEDFHYIDRNAQRIIVRALKSAVFEGLQVVILAVPHRAFDPADVENEVEGRVNYVEVPRWDIEDLSQIAERGFAALGLTIPPPIRRRICDDAFGNPLLMQEVCHELSQALLSDSEHTQVPDGPTLHKTYERVISKKGLKRFDRFAQCAIDGAAPPTVTLRVGGEEATPMVVLAAVARGGPKSITHYAEIRESFIELSRSAAPSPQQVGELCMSMASIVSAGPVVPLEWLPGTQELALTDPFLMFYMRWVLRDRRNMILDQSAIEYAVRLQPRRNGDDKAGTQ